MNLKLIIREARKGQGDKTKRKEYRFVCVELEIAARKLYSLEPQEEIEEQLKELKQGGKG